MAISKRNLRIGALVLLAAAMLSLNTGDTAWGQGGNGVIVDADGVLRVRLFEDPGGRLHKQRVAAAAAALDRDVARPSKLRKVSLNRLEAALKEQVDNNRPATEEMKYLAGLTRVQYVFFYPDSKDIVIAGPAEGWVQDVAGRTVGMHNGDPTLQLQDMITALRIYDPAEAEAPVISVSIDPTQEGLARMQQFLQQLGSRATPNQTNYIVRGLRESMGNQNVVVRGIPANTHFAQVLVEADYRMKLIGIGLERPPARVTTYVDKASPSSVSRNALQRWYFVPDYECVRATADGNAIELVGDGVKLVGEDQVVAADGSRQVSGRVDRASEAFTTSFTQNYGRIADEAPVYAQMRNLIDMAVAAAYIREHRLHDKAEWTMEIFGDEQKYPVQTYNVPQQVETAINSIWKGNRLMTPIGGGVNVQAHKALEVDNLLTDEEGKVQKLHGDVYAERPADNDNWWWD